MKQFKMKKYTKREKFKALLVALWITFRIFVMDYVIPDYVRQKILSNYPSLATGKIFGGFNMIKYLYEEFSNN